MKFDLGALRQIGQDMQQAYQVDGDTGDQLARGLHVYSIQFEPSTGKVSAHIQWPRFRNLVANGADHPATITRMEASQPWLHCSCTVRGVEISACVFKSEVIDTLKELIAEHPESGYEVCEDDDIMVLFVTWQNMTGWGLDSSGWLEDATEGL